MSDHIDPATVEKAARAGFAAAAANAAKHYGLNKPVTWDEHLTANDREHEHIRIRAALEAAAPLIAAKALRDVADDDEFLAHLPEYASASFRRGAHYATGGLRGELRARADALEAGQS